MAMQGYLGIMVRWGRRSGSVEVVLDFGYVIMACMVYGT